MDIRALKKEFYKLHYVKIDDKSRISLNLMILPESSDQIVNEKAFCKVKALWEYKIISFLFSAQIYSYLFLLLRILFMDILVGLETTKGVRIVLVKIFMLL
jgi:hypothetical protein